MRNPSGMNTYHGQEKDRQNWQRSIDKRNKLVDELKTLNIHIDRPHEMRMTDLEALVNQHKITVEANKPKRGEYLSYSQMAKLAGISAGTLHSRLFNKWTLERALRVPVQSRNISLTAAQETKIKLVGIRRKTVIERIRKGMSADEAINKPTPSSRRLSELKDEMEAVTTADNLWMKKPNRTARERRDIKNKRNADRQRRAKLLDEIDRLQSENGSRKKIEELGKLLGGVK